MNTKRLALSAASLTLVLSFLACNVPGRDVLGLLAGGSRAAVDPSVPTNTDGAETILIPGGTFWMGSQDFDSEADEDERPRHQVTLIEFPIYTHEVTHAMYARCVEAGACIPIQALESGPTSHTDDPEYADHPVVGADWNMASDYCTWAGARLPTEAEWERASRSLDSLRYPWGDEEPACDRVNMLGCRVPPDTLEVGSLANGNSAEGVWDMSGNVWEWTHDWYDPDYYALSPAASPLGPNLPEDLENPQKVVRGGGLNSAPEAMRGAARVGARMTRPFDDVGFRCVAQPALDLPADYAEAPGAHERIPPDPLDGGGETVEDPSLDVVASWGFGTATCPDEDGRMRVTIPAWTRLPGDYSATVEGIPYACSYDGGSRILTCEGPVPDSTEHPGRYHVIIDFPGDLLGGVSIDIPTDCPVRGIPLIGGSASASCPDEGGWVTVTFTYEPAVVWDETLLMIGGGFLMGAPCWATSDDSMNCLVHARAPDDPYHFVLRGQTVDGGHPVTWNPVAAVPDDCVPRALPVRVGPLCFEGHPAVEVRYMADTLSIASVQASGVPLDCIGMAPGVQVCGDLSGAPGLMPNITICFADGTCLSSRVTVPDCSSGETGLGHTISSACYPSLGPVAVIQYSPADLPLAAANANGFDLTCVDADLPGYYMCHTLPGTPGSEMTITFCLPDGSCFSDDIAIPDCDESESPERTGTLAGLGCHDESHIFFIVDTGRDWLVPGVDFDCTASDGETEYTCSVHPTIPGRLYCSGERPDSPGTLSVCFGGELTGVFALECVVVVDWPAQEDTIPACDLPVVGPRPEDLPPCSSYASPLTCPTDRCYWYFNPHAPSGGACLDL